MKKTVASLVALLLLAFYLFGLFRWLTSGHTINEVVSTIASDWFLLITFVDLSVFFLLCMIWAVKDMRQRRISVATMIALLLGCLLVGVAPLLFYIIYRNESTLVNTPRLS
ncbi:hypothetical protein [Fibrella arboris]|uniref:hypothetical protein n=1 Tax=Fibrella arboris TaxID=3242486 RepID=UPI00352271E6